MVVLTLVVVLLTSGVAKLRDRRATRDAFTALRVPGVVPAEPGAAALPWVEVVTAALLLAAPAAWLVPVAVVVLLLMLAYTALVARAMTFDEPVTCSCFGGIGRHDVGARTLARNVLLTGLAGAALWYALGDGSVPAALAALDRDGWWAVAAAAAACAVAGLVVGTPQAVVPLPTEDAELLDYERQAIPYGALSLTGGRTVTLAELSATQARLLVVLNPHCGPCVRTAELLDDWAARLAPAVGVVAVYPDAASATSAVGHSADLAAWEPELNVRRVFSVAAPAAVLLGADGFLAGGPVEGEAEVAGFVAEVLAEVDESPAPAE
ncbi:hypothetical protein GCM10011376_00380 [Nocardioides flavus (ex Wang et al. 2016)]|uniref:Thioredoxin domain-containing protein n=1 Tax=Nocardioides flavus (ex Wang et al. 2016) TaxID=2058780 RepID=A0ABQ3HCX8_9ACTN|nr:hypothetical protein GCM10011376_00380 [Nocardioides flavus (ex Wang et al. 2016)]